MKTSRPHKSQSIRRILLHRSSSTHLALLFSGLLCAALVLIVKAASDENPMGRLDGTTLLALGLLSLTSAGLFFISYYVTKRINTIVGAADRIIRTRDLSERFPINNPWDDLGKLAGVLNAMLDDIERLVAGVRQVSDNVAHDLRTPLTRLRNHLERLRQEAADERLIRGLGELTAECDNLLATFNALLRIANIEAGKRQAECAAIDLSALLHDVIELYEPLAQEKQIALSFTPALAGRVMGDKDMLFQAFANLLDNAIKYTDAGGAIALSLTRPLPGRLRLSIADTGCGIPDPLKPMVFRRFYRSESSRTTPGSGLGLSLVQAIVTLHRGTITLEDTQPQGLTIHIEFTAAH